MGGTLAAAEEEVERVLLPPRAAASAIVRFFFIWCNALYSVIPLLRELVERTGMFLIVITDSGHLSRWAIYESGGWESCQPGNV